MATRKRATTESSISMTHPNAAGIDMRSSQHRLDIAALRLPARWHADVGTGLVILCRTSTRHASRNSLNRAVAS